MLDEPLEGVVQALLKPRPAFHEPGKRRPRAFASRADVAQADANRADDASTTAKTLGYVGIAIGTLGLLAGAAALVRAGRRGRAA